jgi:DNA-directed RNA polymerase subunit RPC12/RpoP
MVEEIEGEVIDSKIENLTGKKNYIIHTRDICKQNLYWKIKTSDLTYSYLPEYQKGEKVKILWDSHKYDARLKTSFSNAIKLVRDFSRDYSDYPDYKQLEVLKCPSCGSNVPLEATDKVNCSFCNTLIPLTHLHHESVKLSLDIKKRGEELFIKINELFSAGIESGLFKKLSFIPLILIMLQVFLISWGTFLKKSSDFFSEEIVDEFLMEDYNFALFVTLPSMIFTIIWLFLSRKNAFLIDITYLYSLFVPEINSQKELSCRICGNPLKSTKVPDFIVCPYCQSQNIVTSGAGKMKKIYEGLKLKYITDLMILHNEFIRIYNNQFFGMAAGILFFYGCFWAFAFYLDNLRNVAFITHYFLMPFVLIMLVILISVLASLPYNKVEDWIPKYFYEHLDSKQKKTVKVSLPLHARVNSVMVIITIGLFIVTLFFMR